MTEEQIELLLNHLLAIRVALMLILGVLFGASMWHK